MEDKINYNIIKYLKSLADKKNEASLQTGVQYLQTGLNLWVNDENDNKYAQSDFYKLLENAVNTTTTPQKSGGDADTKFEEYKKILQSKNYFVGTTEGSKEYNDRLQKAKEKFYEKYKSTESSNTNESPEDKKFRAEQLKTQGNDKFKKNDFNGAIQCYTDAINLYSNSIYYCNRGIAYSKLDKHDEAITDYSKCIELDPKYIKAYDRLGYTYLQQQKVNEAIETFNKGLEIDPTNQELQKHLVQAQEQAEDDMGGVGGGGAQNNPLGGGLPNLPQGFNLGNVQEMMQNPNFMQNLGPMLQNPEIMNMTMQLMQDPNFQNMMGNMMQNPNMANLFQGMGGAGGGQNQ
jgi:small glutamine-rich tetratricopeptide repeat-containing protein alpha